MIELRNKTMFIPAEELKIAAQGDTNSVVRVFSLKRWTSDGIDLAALLFHLDLKYMDNGATDTAMLDKEIGDDRITLVWTIQSATSNHVGTVFANIRGVNEDGFVRWRSYQNAFYVESSISVSVSSSQLSQLEQLERKVANGLSGIEYIKTQEQARQNAENARVQAENARKNAENARVQAENARVQAENARKNAENARVQAEANRNTNFNSLKTEVSTQLSHSMQVVDTLVNSGNEVFNALNTLESTIQAAEAERQAAEAARQGSIAGQVAEAQNAANEARSAAIDAGNSKDAAEQIVKNANELAKDVADAARETRTHAEKAEQIGSEVTQKLTNIVNISNFVSQSKAEVAQNLNTVKDLATEVTNKAAEASAKAGEAKEYATQAAASAGTANRARKDIIEALDGARVEGPAGSTISVTVGLNSVYSTVDGNSETASVDENGNADITGLIKGYSEKKLIKKIDCILVNDAGFILSGSRCYGYYIPVGNRKYVSIFVDGSDYASEEVKDLVVGFQNSRARGMSEYLGTLDDERILKGSGYLTCRDYSEPSAGEVVMYENYIANQLKLEGRKVVLEGWLEG